MFFPGIPQLRESLKERFFKKLKDEFDISFFDGDIENVETAEYYIMYSAGAMWLSRLLEYNKLGRVKKIVFVAPAGLSLNRNIVKHIWRYFREIWQLAKVEPLLALETVKESLKISFAVTKSIVEFELQDVVLKINSKETNIYLLKFSSDELTNGLGLSRAHEINLNGGHFEILTNADTINQIKKILKKI